MITLESVDKEPWMKQNLSQSVFAILSYNNLCNEPLDLKSHPNEYLSAKWDIEKVTIDLI